MTTLHSPISFWLQSVNIVKTKFRADPRIRIHNRRAATGSTGYVVERVRAVFCSAAEAGPLGVLFTTVSRYWYFCWAFGQRVSICSFTTQQFSQKIVMRTITWYLKHLSASYILKFGEQPRNICKINYFEHLTKSEHRLLQICSSSTESWRIRTQCCQPWCFCSDTSLKSLKLSV